MRAETRAAGTATARAQRLGVVVRHEMAVPIAGRRAKRPGRGGEIGLATQIDAGAAVAPRRGSTLPDRSTAPPKSAGRRSGP